MNNYKLSPYRRRRSPKRAIIIIVCLLFLAAVGLIVAHRTYTTYLSPVSSVQTTQQITIEDGSSTRQVAKILEDNGLIRSAWAFEWYMRSKNIHDQLQAGEYSLSPSQSTEEIATIITEVDTSSGLITILPAQRLDEIRSSLINEGFDESTVDAALESNRYADHPALRDKPRRANLEGYLYPESFIRNQSITPQDIIRQSLDEMDAYLTEALRTQIKNQGLTVHQGVILASIIEREASDPEDRNKIAQVFYRRLNEDIALQSDPTAFYGAALDGQPQSLTYDSAYNTYNNKGLPPTPIGNVTASSLQAVANPAETDFLYFVSGDDGNTYFSDNLAEHEQLTETYCSSCR